ncbi:MAG: DUF4118 domain-containing protein, partial [Chloroflexi bacterium]|nr:DUF4118 domain-containing protein [Chloroflexota bacterium]
MNAKKLSPIPSTGEDNAQRSPRVSPQFPARRGFWRALQERLISYTYVSSWLPVRLRAWFVGYILAVVLQILVFFFIKLFLPIYPDFNFIEAPILLVVLCLSFLWGDGPGILATLVGALLLFILEISPYFPVEVRRLEDGVSIVLYLAIGLMSGAMIGQARRMQADAILVRQRGMEESKRQKERLMIEREQERDHLRDILAREHELRQIAEDATRQLQTVLEVLPVGVTIADASGRIVQRNAAAFQMWGGQLQGPKDLTEY